MALVIAFWYHTAVTVAMHGLVQHAIHAVAAMVPHVWCVPPVVLTARVTRVLVAMDSARAQLALPTLLGHHHRIAMHAQVVTMVRPASLALPAVRMACVMMDSAATGCARAALAGVTRP